MELHKIDRKVEAEHGVIASFPREFFGYFGWPSIVQMDNGTLVVAASGLRNDHVCPFGRSVICTSTDDGKQWTSPTVVNDLPLDDRDTGITSLGGSKLLISWFSSDHRQRLGSDFRTKGNADWVRNYESALARITDSNSKRWIGAWVRMSDDGGELWTEPIKVDLSAPHGPVRLRSGKLLFFGKEMMPELEFGRGSIAAMTSADGKTWKRLGRVPLYNESDEGNYHEPHVVELADGKLLGLIRIEDNKVARPLKEIGLLHFSLMQSVSIDGGSTWSRAEPFGFHGSPPHLILHSSGAVVCVYGYRLAPFGERAMISSDGGQSWIYDYILRDDGPDHDLGYPASVELKDRSILTIYYQKVKSSEEKCSLLWTRWNLPESIR